MIRCELHPHHTSLWLLHPYLHNRDFEPVLHRAAAEDISEGRGRDSTTGAAGTGGLPAGVRKGGDIRGLPVPSRPPMLPPLGSTVLSPTPGAVGKGEKGDVGCYEEVAAAFDFARDEELQEEKRLENGWNKNGNGKGKEAMAKKEKGKGKKKPEKNLIGVFTPAGGHVVTGSDGGTIEVLELDTLQIMSRTRYRVSIGALYPPLSPPFLLVFSLVLP